MDKQLIVASPGYKHPEKPSKSKIRRCKAMGKVNNMTKGNIRSIILAFYFPLFVTNMLQQLYTFVDATIVGKGLGRDSLAAVGNMGSLSFLVIGFSIGLANGFSVLIAQSFGAKDYEKLRQRLGAVIKLALIVTLVLTVLSVGGLRALLGLLQTDASILDESLVYGYILFGALAFTISYNLSACILRALGDSRTPLKAIIVSSVMNLGLDSLFIFVFRMGVAGAAIATVISQLVATLICVQRIASIEIIHLRRENFSNERYVYTELLKNGVPMAIMNSITAIGCMVVQYFVNGLGVACTAAYSACSKYLNLFMTPANTAGHAVSAFTGQNSGAGRYDRVRRGLMVCVGIAFVTFLILGSLMMFAPEWLSRIILTDSESIMYAVKFLPACGAMIWSVDFLFVFRSTLQGMGKPLVPMLSGILEMTLRVVIIIGFSGTIGFMATAYAEVGAWFGAMMLNMIALSVEIHKRAPRRVLRTT